MFVYLRVETCIHSSWHLLICINNFLSPRLLPPSTTHLGVATPTPTPHNPTSTACCVPSASGNKLGCPDAHSLRLPPSWTPSLMDSPALSAQAPSTAKSPPNSPETHTNPGRNPALKPVRSNPAMHGPRSRAIMVSRAETPRVILLPARQVSPLARTWFQSHTPLGDCSLSHNHR